MKTVTLWSVVMAFALVLTGCSQASDKVLQSKLPGSWYPKEAAELEGQLEAYLTAVHQDPVEDVHALILPHAGYRYSGQTAAYGLDLIKGKTFSRVVILGPTHRVPMKNMASIPDATHYSTPLGTIPLDTEMVASLRKHNCFQHVPQAHDGEHSVQIEVPLLQHVLKDPKIVPIVVGQLDLEAARRIAQILLSEIDAETLVVVSSDFTHYGTRFDYRPFTENVEENLRKLDMRALGPILQKDVVAFYNFLDETKDTICGRYPIAVLLAMVPDDDRVKMLRYHTSGALTGDFDNSVSYFSISFSGQWPGGTSGPEPRGETELKREDKERLLQLARSTIGYIFEHRKIPTAEQAGVELTPVMKQISGSFVTLHKDKRLRGCIGDIMPSRPLHESVIANACNAAFRDRRFAPLTQEELEKIDVEVSVLTPPKAVDSYTDIKIGTHGMILSKGRHRAVFLPQVAPEQGWDLAETLTHLSQKAGLPADGWKEGASFEVFEAIVFGEEHP